MAVRTEPTSIRVPAGEGRAFAVETGRRIRITDVRGKQVCDFFAFVAANPREVLSTACTRWPGGELRPRAGTVFLSNLRAPLLRLLEDGAGGIHDMLVPACSEERYRQEWGIDGHPSCRENCFRAVNELIDVPYAQVPEPVNFFMNVAVTPEMRLEVLEPTTRPGASVLLEVLSDLVVAVSACPMDLNPCNGGAPTDLLVEIVPSL